MRIFKVVCSITDKFGNYELIDVYSYATDLESALDKVAVYMQKLILRRNSRERLGKTYKVICYEQVAAFTAKNKKYNCQ